MHPASKKKAPLKRVEFIAYLGTGRGSWETLIPHSPQLGGRNGLLQLTADACLNARHFFYV
jgi:hypothetical protein